MDKFLTWQLQDGVMGLTGGSLVAATFHPQARVDVVLTSLGLALPFYHERGGNNGTKAE